MIPRHDCARYKPRCPKPHNPHPGFVQRPLFPDPPRSPAPPGREPPRPESSEPEPEPEPRKPIRRGCCGGGFSREELAYFQARQRDKPDESLVELAELCRD
jgi:hypothetical protein